MSLRFCSFELLELVVFGLMTDYSYNVDEIVEELYGYKLCICFELLFYNQNTTYD
jgi:hypothetical protein